jgi:hypothetical protein
VVRLLRLGAPPVVAFALARLLLSWAAVSVDIDPLRSRSWCRSDCGLYLDIAMRGYRTVPCAADPELTCGNAGWMPLFPLIVKGLRAAGVRTRRAAAIVSALATLATLGVLWAVHLVSWPRRLGLPTLALAAVFPGVVYHHASFPISLFTLLCLVWLAGLVRDRTAAAAVAAPLAAFTYTTGLLLGPATLGAGLLAFRSEWRRWLVVAAATALGPLAVVVWHQYALGTWDAFWQTQAKYGHGLYNPLATLVERLEPLRAGWAADPHAAIPAAQTLLVLLWVATLAVVGLRSRATLDRNDVILLVFVALYWLVPLVAGRAALHRAESTLLLSVLLARRLPVPILVAFAVASGVMAWAMGRLFFASVLV